MVRLAIFADPYLVAKDLNVFGKARAQRNMILVRKSENEPAQKDEVAHLTLSKGHRISLWPSVPPLQVAPNFACSVASLSRFPSHSPPGCNHLRGGILAGDLLG